jgi:hypothetical protein
VAVVVRPTAVPVELQLPYAVDLHYYGVDGPERDRSVRDVILDGRLKLNRRRGGRVGCFRLPFRPGGRAAGDQGKHRHEDSYDKAWPETVHLTSILGDRLERSHTAPQRKFVGSPGLPACI